MVQCYGVLLAEEGRPREARRLLQHAVKLDREMLHAWQAWAVLEDRVGNFKSARDVFRKAIMLNPNHNDLVFVWQVCSANVSVAACV